MKFNKTAIAALVVTGSVGLYALAGFVVLPGIAKSKLPGVVKEAIGVEPKVQAIRFNPFSFRLEVDGFELPAADGKVLAGFAGFMVDFEAWQSLRSGVAVFDSVILSAPVAAIERRADGAFNFSALVPKSQAAESADPEQSSEPPPLLIHRLALENGQASWLDDSVGADARESAMPINLSIDDLSLRANSASTLALTLELASGGKLSWHGDLNPGEWASAGRIELDNLDLPKVWQLFLQDILPLVISEGRLALRTDYRLTKGDQGVQLQLDNAGVELKQLNLAVKDRPEHWIEIPNFAVHGASFDLAKQEVNVASVSSSDAHIRAWLENDGRLNYQVLFAGESPATAPATPVAAEAPAGNPWVVKLNEIALNNYQIQFTDKTQPKPVEILLSELNCLLQNFNSAEPGKLPLRLSTRFNNSGTLNLSGDFGLAPFAADWTLDVRDIYLKTFQSYIDPYVGLEVVDGVFSSKGHLTLSAAEEFQLKFQGDADIDRLITRDRAKNKDFVKWTGLDVDQITVDVAKQDFKFGKIAFDQPYFRFMIKKDGTTNIDDILVKQGAEKAKNQAAPDPKTSTAAKTHDRPVIAIGKVEIKNGTSDFADYSLILPFIAEMNSLNGEVDGFASNTDDAAKLKLNGKVYDMATVAIKGQYQFQSNDSDIALSFSHMPLPLVTPYMAEFAGYKIEKGQMALDLQYTIKRGQLAARNKVLIDQLTLGEKVENPKAVSLPLELAIALLKDGDGRINLDFPISGSLEDPQFSVGALVADVLVNLVSKVAAAPFKAIASMFDDDADLSVVSFAAGASELTPEETAKLARIGQALKEKQELVLEVKGVAYQAQDWPSLRADVVMEVLKKMKSGELRDKGEKIRSEYIELTDDDYKRLLAKFYAEVFPQEIDYGLLGKPRMKNNRDVDFYQTARLQLEAIMQPEPQRLNDLAVARANRIAKYLAEQAGVEKGRIYLLATDVQNGSVGEAATAQLSLNVGH